MAARPTKRIGFLRPKDELERLRDARHMLTSATSCYPINSEAYRSAEAAIRAIDAVADAFVGNREFFWLQLERSRHGRRDTKT